MRAPLRRRCAALLAGVLGAAGCFSRPAIVSQSFSIDPPAPRTAIPERGVVLELAHVEVSPQFSGQRLMYQSGEHEFVRDPYARFVAPPSWLLTVAIRGYLENAAFVRDVAIAGRGPRPDALVHVAVTQLSGELRDGGSSAKIALRVRVTPEGPSGRRGPAILLKMYSSTVPVPDAKASAIVDGWNRGLAQIMAELEPDLLAALTVAGLPAQTEPSRGNDPGSR